MLETNNPYMFGSSTTTTTTQQPPPPPPPPPSTFVSSSSSMVPTSNTTASSKTIRPTGDHLRPVHHTNYYAQNYAEEDYYHTQAAHISPNFVLPEEQSVNYKYKNTIKPNSNTTNLHNDTERSNYARSSAHIYPPQPIKTEPTPNMLPSLIKSNINDSDHHWYEREAKAHKPVPMATAIAPVAMPTPGEASTLEAGDNKKNKRRKEMSSLMEELNQDFLKKKERFYMEKMSDINQELKQLHQGKHMTYLDSLRDLEISRNKMINDGRLFREYQNQVTDDQFQLEIYHAEEEYTAETQEIREKLFSVLEEKRRKLKEEKDNCELAYDVILESQSRMHKRNLRKRGPEHTESKTSKKKQLTGPALVFKLKDDDILSDIQAMRSGLSTPVPAAPAALKKTNSSNKKK